MISTLYLALNSVLKFSYSDFWYLGIGSFLVHESLWVIVNLFYMVLDCFDLYSKYRIGKDRIPIVVQGKLFLNLFSKHILVLLPLQILAIPLYKNFGLKSTTGISKHNIFTIPLYLVFFCCIEETLFYWIHRLFHHPYLYKKFHYVHHELDSSLGSTCSLNGEYSHWFENLANDIIPFLAGPSIAYSLGITTPYFVWYSYIAFRLLKSADAHSGYDLPYNPLNLLRPIYQGTSYHTKHHSFSGRKGNFGTFTMWDNLMGTVL